MQIPHAKDIFILNFVNSTDQAKMLVTVKDIRQRTFQIDVNEFDTVGQLKAAIESKMGVEFEAAKQKLIYAGQILNETDRQLKEYSVSESGFVVVMVPPKKDVVAAATTNSLSVAAPKPPPPDQPFGPDSIDKLIELGYPRVAATEAIFRCNGNVEHAIEYLCSQQKNSGGGATANSSSSSTPPPPPLRRQVSSVDNKLAFLRNDPQFLEMRRIVQSDATALRDCIGQIAQTNTELFELITTNQQDFIDLLNEDAVAVAAAMESVSSTALPPLSNADLVAIDRLKDMGFVEADVLEAYLVCDRDENRAAEFLLNQFEE